MYLWLQHVWVQSFLGEHNDEVTMKYVYLGNLFNVLTELL